MFLESEKSRNNISIYAVQFLLFLVLILALDRKYSVSDSGMLTGLASWGDIISQQ